MFTIENKFNALMDLFVKYGDCTQEDTEYLCKIYNACIVANILGKKGISYCHWQEGFHNETLFNNLIRLLSDTGWVECKVENNFSTISLVEKKILEYISAKEFAQFKLDYLVARKTMQNTKAKHNNVSCLRMPSDSGGTKKIKMLNNLIREGFRKAGNVPFKYDVGMLLAYTEEFFNELTKGLMELSKEHNSSISKIEYKTIVQSVLTKYLEQNATYTLGECVADSRGRAIFDALKKIGNPIQSKLFRAIIRVTPHKLQEEALPNVYLAIANIMGGNFTNEEEKVLVGRDAYEQRLQVEELYENIWLNRIYKALDAYFITNEYLWDVPIEIDVKSSMMVNMALLLNNHSMMKECNLIEGEDTYYDPWYVEGVDRTLIKKTLTPRLYGSRDKLRTALADEEGEVNYEALLNIADELAEGKYCLAEQFKTFILDNCNTEPEMTVQIGEEIFDIACNRFKWDKSNNKRTFLCWDTNIGVYFPITREVMRTPDTTTFNLYMVTLLLF